MATSCSAFSPSRFPSQQHHHHHHHTLFYVKNCQSKSPPLSYNSLVYQAATLLGPPTKFESSKLKVVSLGEEATIGTCVGVVPRTYTLSHCDFTADLTLTVSTLINRDQLEDWYNKDAVLAEWTNVRGSLFLDVHCYVSGKNPLQELAAELRYYIFSKELPLVLEAILYGDSVFFDEHQELMDALVRVFFHSRSKKFDRVECWGPVKDAAKGRQEDRVYNLLPSSKDDSQLSKLWSAPKSIFRALFAFLL